MLYQQDAKYFYYDHGPLARTEIGDQKVQAMDYAYTIQGWIKSVNGEEVDEATMMGADGNSDPLASTNINQHGARDAFGYSLSYFEDDYHSSNTAMLNHSKGANPNLAANIYNGNIGSMFTALSDENENAIGTHQTKYTYDQLNRIMSMQGFDRTVGAPESGSNYMAEYEYDENGNLTNLLRLAGSSGVIDKLSYVYDDPVNGGFNNRLTQVQDDEGQVLSVDLDDQSPNNYEYDEIGQLIKDEAEKIASINWTVNNKVDFIEYQPGEAIETIQFEYGAMGNRISKRVYSALSDSVITTYYILDAQGNSMSKYKLYENVGSNSDDNLYLSERNIYGSDRVGMEKIGEIIASSDPGNIDINTDVAMITGDKFFEMSNHLGNVLQVVTDNKLPENDGQNGIDHYVADVVSYSDYYPFGMQMPNRNGSSGDYRYGFNGMESDNEIKGGKNSYDFGARMYDSRVGKWLSVDPQSEKYKSQSPYHFAFNNPIIVIDPNGEENIIVIGSVDVTGEDRYKFINSGLNQLGITLADQNESAELTTLAVYSDGMSEGELSALSTKIHDLRNDGKNVKLLEVSESESLTNYMNSKDIYTHQTTESRENDRITDVTMFGHGYAMGDNGSSSFESGHGIYGKDTKDHDDLTFDTEEAGSLFSKAFAKNSTWVYYSCNAATPNSNGDNLVKSTSEQLPHTEVSGWHGKTDYEDIYSSKTWHDWWHGEISPADNLPKSGKKNGTDPDREDSEKITYKNGEKL